MNTTKTKEEFIEKGAALEHARWAKWQNYLHSFLTWNDELKAWVLPHEQKDRWQCQINTYYDMLSEKEKESDRKEVRQYLPLIDKIIALAHQSGREEGFKEGKNYFRSLAIGENAEDVERKAREEMKQECLKAVPEKDNWRMLESQHSDTGALKHRIGIRDGRNDFREQTLQAISKIV